MPIFNVACECGNTWEHFDRSANNPTPPICEKCGKEGLREFGLTNAHYKGRGFFTNDYKTEKQQQDRVNYLGTPD